MAVLPILAPLDEINKCLSLFQNDHPDNYKINKKWLTPSKPTKLVVHIHALRATADYHNPALSGLIGGDREPFKVVLSLNVDTDVDDLKQVIHTKGTATKSSVLPKDLILWKVWTLFKHS